MMNTPTSQPRPLTKRQRESFGALLIVTGSRINWSKTHRAVWEAACRHDGISVTSSFVTFSAQNPYTRLYNLAAERFGAERANGRS